MKILFYSVLMFGLTSCVTSGGNINLPADTFVDGATDIAPIIADASTAKEAIVHKSIQNYHKQYIKAFKQSGTSITFAMQEVAPGVFVQVMSKVTSRGDVKMFEPPTKPSEHPVWGVVNNVLDKAVTYGFGYLAVDSVVGGFKALGDSDVIFNTPEEEEIEEEDEI